MKQLVKEYVEIGKVSFHDLVCSESFEDKIIAYRANGRRPDTLAVLQKQTKCSYGWAYHTDLIKQRSVSMKFVKPSEHEAINAVLDTGRQILVFDSIHEFIKYAGKISEPG